MLSRGYFQNGSQVEKPGPTKYHFKWLGAGMRRIRIAIVACAVLVIIAALYWLVLRPAKSPADRMAGLWAGRGVRKPNVIIITLDTTRADHLACYGYENVKTPNLDALAGRGVLFEQAASSSPLTLPSHCSIMTGMYPTYHGVRINGNTALSEEQTTIAEVLTNRGYQCGAFIGAFVLDGRWGLKQGFAHYDDQFDLTKYRQLDLGVVRRPGNVVMDAALTWLEANKRNPFFAWIHLYDPHMPYEPPEPYYSTYSPGGLVGLYDGEIAFADEQVGRCLSWLEGSGLAQDTILVVIADHGEGLGSHGEGSHGYFIYDYVTHVPLLVVVPFAELQGKRVASQVRAVDVFPTIFDLLGVKSPSAVQGRSVLPLMIHPESDDGRQAYGESLAPFLQFGWSPLHALKTKRYQFIDAPQMELYDLESDPQERTNILEQNPAVARKMKAELDRLMAETSRGAPKPQAANLDKETVERLAALGYIGAPENRDKPSGASSGPLADPKIKLPIYESIQLAGESIMRNDYAQAARKLEDALGLDPNVPQALLMLSTCYTELGREEEAKARLEQVLRMDPESIQAMINLARILRKQKKNEDVIALCQKTLSLDKKTVQAFMLIGEVYMEEQDHARALPYLEKAYEIQPKLTQNGLNLAACLLGLKQYARAEPMLKDIVRRYPKFPRANYNLGLLREEQGRSEEARAAYSAELSLYPKEFQARFNLGKLLFKLGDRRGYLDQMREMVKNAPHKAEGYLFLARGLLLESGPLPDVQSLVDKGLSLAQTSELKALGYFLLADIYNRQHQTEKMEEALRKAKSYQVK